MPKTVDAYVLKMNDEIISPEDKNKQLTSKYSNQFLLWNTQITRQKRSDQGAP